MNLGTLCDWVVVRNTDLYIYIYSCYSCRIKSCRHW